MKTKDNGGSTPPNIEARDEFHIEVKERKIIATPVQPTKAQTDVAPAVPERMCQHERY